MENTKVLPLFFTYADIIPGAGFLARVRIVASVIAEGDDDGKVWFFGVHPGAIAESGHDINSAALNFRNALRLILFDFAREANSFAEFSASAQRFFDDTDPLTVGEWDAARAAVREGKITHADLPRVTDDPTRIEVEEFEQRTPSADEVAEALKFAA